jgi:Flp pilus assembly pilin Flp
MYDAIQYALIVAALASGLIMLIVGVLSAIDQLLDFCGGDDAED